MKAVLALVALLGAGCTHSIHMFGATSYAPRTAGARPISARTEQFVVLRLIGDTNYVDQAYDKLLAQCPDGEIVGVTTKFSTSHGFLSYTNKLRLDGQCVPRT